MQREFTATAYIISQGKILLILHKKFGRWLPPGGHLLPGELPHEAAIREAKEETGLDICLLSPPQLSEKEIPRPDFQFLYDIPSFRETPAHEHIDFGYIAKPSSDKIIQNREETDGIRWFSYEEIQKEPLLDNNTRQITCHLLQSAKIYKAAPSDLASLHL